ncbi:LTA synthase family protein [Zophobihabitans entericus]|uniref:Sulfatase-like hydrolase/transferase n=1 Tax=Zophobihabitans entericus TaxID=1635327 RepID=A0A6G9I980_9GAMM|nr:LTA synthase family protein [Zophobihabitans entericus]QIQ20389.1 sulfatase-like hydrolase/transferase [Zophobihabitans entericus]
MRYAKFKQIFIILLVAWLISLLIQSIARFYFVNAYITTEFFPLSCPHQLPMLFLTGLKIDVKISSLIYSVILLLLLLPLLFSPVSIFNRLLKYIPILLTLITLTFLLLAVINIYNYTSYDNYIDVLLFGLFGNTSAILMSFGQNYPILQGLVIFTVLAFGLRFFYARLQHYITRLTRRMSSAVLFSIIFITCFGIAICVVTPNNGFPLNKTDSHVSRYAVLNMFIPNGQVTLGNTCKDNKLKTEFKDIDEETGAQLLTNFYGEEKPASLEIFQDITPANEFVAQKPPHIVFSIMESMSSHLLELSRINNDLLGDLRMHFQQDWRFTRFVSEGDGTIDSLSRLLVRSPISKISESYPPDITFESNMLKPFLDQGYKIVFITSGSGTWRNIGNFLRYLGVSEIIEQGDLHQKYPESEITTTGIPDEYMFRYAQERLSLAEQQGEHVMIMMLSSTNHPPFRIPPGYPYFNYQLTSGELERLSALGSQQTVSNILNVFRYSNHKLGQFISWVKQQPLGDKTIIAVTGDHNMRSISYSNPREKVLGHAVPFYLYVPTYYQINTIFDPTRVGSHKDIFPTLYHLALSETPYYKMGCNLVGKELDPLWCNSGYNPNVAINQSGAFFLKENEFRPWNSSGTLQLGQITAVAGENHIFLHRWQDFTKIQQWQILQQIKNP